MTEIISNGLFYVYWISVGGCAVYELLLSEESTKCLKRVCVSEAPQLRELSDGFFRVVALMTSTLICFTPVYNTIGAILLVVRFGLGVKLEKRA